MIKSVVAQKETLQWKMQAEALANNNLAKVDKLLTPDIRRVVVADGRKHTVLNFSLAANSLVDKFDIIVTANRAALVLANLAADVRVAEGESQSIVIDFGIMLTVNSARVPDGFTITKVYPWFGTQFGEKSILGSAKSRSGQESPVSNLAQFADVKTERLLIVLGNKENASSVLESIQLSLPDLPSGLTLRINQNEPFWQHDAMIQLEESDEVSEDSWNSLGKRRVSIANALAEYTGDATNTGDIEFELLLSSAIPGLLTLEIETQSLRHIHRLSFENEKSLTLSFPIEGEQQLIISPPANIIQVLSGLEFSLSGELNPIRALPPIGPDPNEITELTLGKGRAASVRLDGNLGLVELAALRFPLRTNDGGAEARVVLWKEKDGVPIEALQNGVSKPVNWTGTSEQWIRFDFNQVVILEENVKLWAALIVNRGEAIWKMSGESEFNQFPIRIGSPEGPWRALPAIFGSTTTLGNVSGRVHLLGNADQTKPLAPLLISLQDGPSLLEFTPSEEATRISLAVDSNSQNLQLNQKVLRFISRSEGTIKIDKVDVITGEKI